MSKKNRNHQNSETTEAAETEVIIDMTTEATTAAPAETTPVHVASTEIVQRTESDAPFAELAKILPAKMRASLMATRMVTPEEFDSALARLDDVSRDAVQGLIERLNPTNDFDNNENTRLNLQMLKMDQGAGDDPARPENSVKGAFYTKPTGELLIVPQAFEKTLKLPSRLKVYVLALYNGRMFFAPKDSTGKPIPPPGVELRGNAPICVSYDRNVGSHYDECRACPYRPFANGSYDKDACKDNVDMYVVTADFSHMLRVPVAATSFKTSTDQIRQKTMGRRFWDVAFYLSTEKTNPKPGQEFYKLKASLVNENNPNGDPTPVELRPMLELFARQVRTELYLPALGATYARAKNKTDGAASGAAASTNDLLAAADSMDYSNAGSGNV